MANAEYYLKHREERLAAVKEHYRVNRAKKLAYAKKYREKHAEKLREYNATHRDEKRAYNKAYQIANRAKMIEKTNRYFEAHPGYRKVQFKRWYDNNRDKIRVRKLHYGRKRRKTDPLFRLQSNLRARIHQALKSKKRPSGRTMEVVGCTRQFLKGWLESRWQPGMSWDNYSQHGWHVDHIIPCSVFDFSNPEEAKQCFHYTNLQPLWAKDNLLKSNFVGEAVRNRNKTSGNAGNVATREPELKNAKNQDQNAT